MARLASSPTLNANSIRVVTLDGNPWFVAKDVCIVLRLTNTTAALLPLTEDSVAVNPIEVNLSDGRKQVRRMSIISESGLYKLIMRSDKPQAREFQDWVTREVLPSIRKNGGYIAGQEKVRSGEMSDLEFLARAQEVAQRVLSGSGLTPRLVTRHNLPNVRLRN